MEAFYKYQGLGNDFVVLDRRPTGLDISAAESQRLCDRHFGIGADGVLTILPHEVGARMVVHNADGSTAEMCGNGLRCVVHHLVLQDSTRPTSLRVATGAGVLSAQVSFDGGEVESVTVDLGPARLEAPHLPRGPGGGPFRRAPIGGVVGTAVSLGNPHLVLLDTPSSLAGTLGPQLEVHPLFPERTNVEFVRRVGAGLDVVVWERGVGLTLACGTGACAAVVAAGLEGLVPFDEWVPVKLPGGDLRILARADLSQVLLQGPSRRVFEGRLP